MARGPWRALARPLLDRLAAAFGLVFAAPLLLLAALLIVLTDGRPVFFLQTRVGLNGRPFRIIKLRTMRRDHAHRPMQIIGTTHAAITPLGRWLRALKFDELPQLLNILRGEMALIGPRPTVPEQVERYTPWQHHRLRVKPGLTGLAQVHGETGLSWPQRIDFDVVYVATATWRTDLWILWRTPWLMFGSRPQPIEQTPFAPALDRLAATGLRDNPDPLR